MVPERLYSQINIKVFNPSEQVVESLIWHQLKRVQLGSKCFFLSAFDHLKYAGGLRGKMASAPLNLISIVDLLIFQLLVTMINS